ncbi:hypothetical protein OKW39_002013 [Paraburkholderia sp. MM6662-R1]
MIVGFRRCADAQSGNKFFSRARSGLLLSVPFVNPHQRFLNQPCVILGLRHFERSSAGKLLVRHDQPPDRLILLPEDGYRLRDYFRETCRKE